MATFRGNVSAWASVNTNPFLLDELETLGANMDAVCRIAGGPADHGNITNPFLMSMEFTSGGVAHTQAPLPSVAWPPTPPPSVTRLSRQRHMVIVNFSATGTIPRRTKWPPRRL